MLFILNTRLSLGIELVFQNSGRRELQEKKSVLPDVLGCDGDDAPGLRSSKSPKVLGTWT